MLFRYNNKVYVRPFANKIIEVEVVKKGKDFDVKSTNKQVEITPEVDQNLYSVTIEEAYDMQNNGFSKDEDSLKSKRIFKD